MRHGTRIVLACGLLLLAAAGCPRVQSPAGGATVGTSRIGWATKAVAAKREPETLVAGDGTICRVSPDRFSGTKSGDRVECNWQ